MLHCAPLDEEQRSKLLQSKLDRFDVGKPLGLTDCLPVLCLGGGKMQASQLTGRMKIDFDKAVLPFTQSWRIRGTVDGGRDCSSLLVRCNTACCACAQ